MENITISTDKSKLDISLIHRKQGLFKKLIKEILTHPDLQGLRRILLGTADAHELYRQFGFRELAKPERFMEIKRLSKSIPLNSPLLAPRTILPAPRTILPAPKLQTPN